jgi:thiol-disulfide isomerase/thioredoxin
MSETDNGNVVNRHPRWIAGMIVGAIALASAAALGWPSLPVRGAPSPSNDVGVIRSQIETSGTAGRIGAPAPDFDWNAADGKVVRLSDLRAKAVVINFWATWCQPCRQEMPALNRVASSSQDVIFLEVDLQEAGDKVRPFFDELALDRLTPLVDPDGATARRYGVLSVPSTFFVDGQGIIRHLEIGGPMTDDQIRLGIAKAS